VQSEYLCFCLRPKRDRDGHRFHLFRERIEFSLLLLDFAANSVQLIADLKNVFHGCCPFQNRQLLLFLRSKIAQTCRGIHVLRRDIQRFEMLAFDAESQLADFSVCLVEA